MNFLKMDKKYNLKYFISLLFLIIFFLYIYIYVTNKWFIEGLEDMNINTSLSSDFASNFCNENNGGKSEKACGRLTRNNCMKTSCCIWTNKNKCSAGDADGLKFYNLNDESSAIKYYYYKNKRYDLKTE
jgi:hypothetical protein